MKNTPLIDKYMSKEMALDVWRECTNGHYVGDGASSSKGGRYWLEGEFTLTQLKALIVLAECKFAIEGYDYLWDHP